jgi:glycosyltransferase involved in cell wall biosynthesis
MKILLATPLYPPDSGGPSTYAKMLMDELPKRGIEVTLVKFGDVKHLPPGLRHVAYFFNCVTRAHGASVIYALDPVSVGLPAALVALVTGKKLLLRVPGDFAWEQGRQRFGVTDELDEFQTKKYSSNVERLRRIQKFVARRAVAIVTPSQYMQRVVSGWVNDASKVKTIYSSVQLPVAYELPAELPQGKAKKFEIVTIARRVPWKGIEALERVVAREGGWHFTLIADLPHKQAMGLVKLADVFVLNSTYEGLSHALLETMALGTPIVATNVGGNPELITMDNQRQNGLLIPPKDDQALFEALKQIELNPAEARVRAERAKEKAQQFSIDITIEQLVTLLKSL